MQHVWCGDLDSEEATLKLERLVIQQGERAMGDTNSQLKTFVVYLTSGVWFKVRAHHFKTDGGRARVYFYAQESQINDNIFLSTKEVAAIVAEEDQVT